MEKTLYILGTALGGILQIAAAWWCFRLNSSNCSAAEKLPRNRLAGAVIGLIALLICIPHAQAVSPAFLLPFLMPLAVVIPILSYFFLDHCLARAIGGVMILWAYYWINASFALNSPMMWLIAITAWFWGAIGIWISGKPWAIRDWIRKCCTSAAWRNTSAVLLFLFALTTLLSTVMEVL